MQAPPRAFANRDVFLPAWYPVVASRALARRGVERVVVGPHALVVWRGDDGVAHVSTARCPHLGADLGRGRVVHGTLRCVLHHWRFAGDGACVDAPHAMPGRCLRTFATFERWGLVFAWLGPGTPVPFPQMPNDDGDREDGYWRVLLPASRLACHHHLTTANGLDAVHFEALHGLRSLAPWHHEVDAPRGAVHLFMHQRPASAVQHALFGSLRSRFSAHGPSVAWVTALDPVRLHALFVTRPHEDGGSWSRTVLFVPKDNPLRALRACGFLLALLLQDKQQLDALRDFHPGFVDSDEPLRDYGALIDAWPPGSR